MRSSSLLLLSRATVKCTLKTRRRNRRQIAHLLSCLRFCKENLNAKTSLARYSLQLGQVPFLSTFPPCRDPSARNIRISAPTSRNGSPSSGHVLNTYVPTLSLIPSIHPFEFIIISMVGEREKGQNSAAEMGKEGRKEEDWRAGLPNLLAD